MTASSPSTLRRSGRQALIRSLLAGALALPLVASADAQEGRTTTAAQAAPGEGIQIGTGLDIVGAVGSLFGDLYYGFDSSYIDKFYGGSVAGYFLDMLTDTDRTEVELDYIIDQLSAIDHKLNQLISLADAIEKEIGALEKEIKIETVKIEQHITASGIAAAESNIENYTDKGELLTKFRNVSPNKITNADRSYITATCQEIVQAAGGGLNPDNDQSNWLNTINTGLMPVGPQNPGLIQLLASQAQLRMAAGTDPYDAYLTMETYFLRYVLLQSKAINLYVECARVLPVSLTPDAIETQYLTYLSPVVQQFAQFRQQVETVILNSSYDDVRQDFMPGTASTTVIALLEGYPKVLPRLDYVIDQALGTIDLAGLANNPAAFLKRPRGTLSARILTGSGRYADGYPLTFTPFIPDCPAGFQETATWQIANGSTDTLTIAWLNAWNGPHTGWNKTGYDAFEPKPAGYYGPAFYGSHLYQMAAAPLTLNPNETGQVRLCAVPGEVKQPDMSLFLDYRLTAAGATTQGPLQPIQWRGNGEIDQTDPPFFVDAESRTITFGKEADCSQCQPSYSAAYTGTPSALAGVPFMTWDGATIKGASQSYQMIRYGFADAPLGQYAVTGPDGTDLIPNQHVNVVRFDRQLDVIGTEAAPADAILADSQTRRRWETFVLEDYQASADGPEGTLLAANGEYVVVNSQGELVADADTGQKVTFVGWSEPTDMASRIASWGKLQFADAGYLRIEVYDPGRDAWVTAACPPADPTSPWPQTRTTIVPDADEATIFKTTFIDKGKDALEAGKSYAINLAYGIECDQAPVSCPKLLGGAESCLQYYLYANIGYPYGYFTAAPVMTAGGFGKSFGRGPGESPFPTWSFGGEELDCNPQGFSPNGGFGHTDHDGTSLSVRVTTSDKGGPAYACAEPWAWFQTSLFLEDTQCTYHFTLTMSAETTFGETWNGASHDDLKEAKSYLHFDRKTSDGKTQVEKSASFEYGVSRSDPYVAKDIVYYADPGTYATDNEAWVVYGAQLNYNAGVLAPWWSDTPIFSLNVDPDWLQLKLTGITDNKQTQGSCPVD